MLFAEYDSWLGDRASGLVLDETCTVIGPYCTPTVSPNKPPWETELTVIFNDGQFLCIAEHWYKRKSGLGGAGYRNGFSFHYGPANPQRDDDGVPLRSSAYPAIIRIDQDDRIGPHLHFNGEDHIPQNRVRDLSISNADMFDFIQAVLIHRKSGESFDKIMKFKVIA